MEHIGGKWECVNRDVDHFCNPYVQQEITNSWVTVFDGDVSMTADESFKYSVIRCTDKDAFVSECTVLCNNVWEDCNGMTLYCPNQPLMTTGGKCTLEV